MLAESRRFVPILTTLLMLGTASVQSTGTKPQQLQYVDAIVELRSIEAAISPPTIVAGPPQHFEIIDYYCAANSELCDRFEYAKQSFASQHGSPFRAMTLVAGSAGIGKSFIRRRVYNEIPDEQVWKFDIRELFDDFAHRDLAALKPDLQVGNRVFNRLLSLNPAGRKAFAELLESSSAAFVVVDSLDEIHPDDYLFVLDQLERLAVSPNRDFIHLVVFGRPLAFQEYLRTLGNVDSGSELRVFLLREPVLQTTGDLAVSSWNYDCWKYALCRGPSNQPRPMLFEDYQRWCDGGFLCEGEFADVVFDKNAHMTAEAREQLRRWAMKHRIVAGLLRNLAANEIVRVIAVDRVEHGAGFDERRFMNDFLSMWLERDTRSDDRPSRLKQRHLDLYLQLLEAIAVKYAAADRIDDLGYFDVSADDQVVIHLQGKPIAVPVRQVLNRSGLVTMDPESLASGRTRFEPFWFHRMFVQMHRERQARESELTSAVAPPLASAVSLP